MSHVCRMYVASKHVQEILEAFFVFFKHEKMVFNGKKECVICVRIG